MTDNPQAQSESTTLLTTPDKPKPKECAFWDLWCKAQQSLFGSGEGGGIIPGLEAAPKIPLLA